MSDVWQQPGEGTHALSQCICDLVTKSKFTHPATQEMLKLMILQHAVWYHEARDWIRQQDQSQLTYQALFSHCKLLEQHCDQYEKARERGHANLASTTTASTSSIHMDALSLEHHNCFQKCGYSHPNTKCPAQGQQCYTCSGYNHFTVLCKQRRCKPTSTQTQHRGNQNQCTRCSVSRPHGQCQPSCSPHRHCHCSASRTPSHSPSCRPSHSTLPWWSGKSHCCATPQRYYQDFIEVIPAYLGTSGNCAEGMLFTESTSDGQTAFYTHLQMPSCDGTKSMTAKIDPGAQVNNILLNKYCHLFPKMLTKSKDPKAKALLPTQHTWISHDGSPKPFLGHFVAEIMHASEPRSYPTCFYMFGDATSPHILLSYTTLERLGIIQFNVPNLAATTHINHVALPSSPSGQRKTTTTVTFWDPIQETGEASTSSNVSDSPSSHSGMRKTSSHQKSKVGSSTTKTRGTVQNPSISQSQKTTTTPPSKTTKSILHPSPCTKVQSPLVTSPCSTAQIQDIIVLKRNFLDSFDTIGNTPGTYTIRTHPAIPPVQHARWKVPIEYREQIENALDEMVLKGIIAPVSRPTAWVSLLTYPCKPDGSLHICLDPKGLNKAIV